jgi:drug/metabolite transporter superfamily protein YnfA
MKTKPRVLMTVSMLLLALVQFRYGFQNHALIGDILGGVFIVFALWFAFMGGVRTGKSQGRDNIV